MNGLLPLRKDKVCLNNEDHTFPNRMLNAEGHGVCIIQRNLSSLQFSTLNICTVHDLLTLTDVCDVFSSFLKENAGITFTYFLEDVSNTSVPHSFPHISPSPLTHYINYTAPPPKKK